MKRDHLSQKILIVEDEHVIREQLACLFNVNGFEVAQASNGREGVRLFQEYRPDVVLMDVMMPVLDGYSACRVLRELDRETPIIFLSALDSDIDQIKGLDVGGDDYVSKTASDALLLARINKAIDRGDHFAKIDAPSEMTKTEADIFRVLLSNPGHYFSYREIFSAICGEGYFADEGAIRVHISHIRKKLPQDMTIEAKRGVGFSLRLMRAPI